MEKTPHYSYKLGNLPKGCRLCVKGSKLVLFVTGICSAKCYFCPISDKKYGKDVVYADEWPIKNDKELLEEARLIEAEGAGITGGDPLARLDRTVRHIKLLKKKFGRKFHIHLYTPLVLVDDKNLKKLYNAGLDEIRFHPNLDDGKLWNRIGLAKKLKWKVGVEIPVIPGKEKETKVLIGFISDKVDFLNLNELEVSDNKVSKLSERGFKTKDELSYGVKGSEEMALRLLKYCKIKNVHYCTATLKDKVQLGNRIKRRAKNVAKSFDIINKDGTLTRGVIYLSNLKPSFNYKSILDKTNKNKSLRIKIIKQLKIIKNNLKKEFKIKDIEVDDKNLRLITSIDAVEMIKDRVNKEIFRNCLKDKKILGLKDIYLAIVTEYPTYDGIILDLEFL